MDSVARPGYTPATGETKSDEVGRLRLLHDLATAFAARIELDDLVQLIMTKCRDVLDAEGASVLLLDPATNELYFPYVADEQPDVAERLARLRFPADRGVAGDVLRTARAVRVDDVARARRFYRGVDDRTGITTRTLLCAPLPNRG